MKLTGVERLDGGNAARLTWTTGERARFHAVWLRDNALDPATRSPKNGQRLITLSDFPSETSVAAASLTGGGDLSVTFRPEEKTVVFPAAWLFARRYDRNAPPAVGWVDAGITLWDASLGDHVPTARFGEVSTSRHALGGWLADVRRYGFALLSGVARKSGALCRVAELFGYVRETNYGRWFDVRAEVDPNNLAYTNLGLQAHTDNPYRDPVPTLQLLACLENTVEGGESMVVDGFMAARKLRDESPAGFDLLCRHSARFEYAGSAGVRLRSKRPILELAPDGELMAIRFNNRSAAAITDVPYDAMPDFYAAYRRLSEIIDEPASAVTFKLQPGELFIVDNTRVLHARRAFSSGGTRWLQGCYADKDGLLSTLAAIEEEEMGEAAE